MHEVYDEIVFVDPTPDFKSCLMMYSKPESSQAFGENVMAEHFTPFDDEEDLYRLALIRDHIAREIQSAKDRLTIVDADITTLHSAGVIDTRKPSTGNILF